jgi:hypothetical protein
MPDVVFTAKQDIDDARAFYASVKGRLPKYGRCAKELIIMPGLMPIVGRNAAKPNPSMTPCRRCSTRSPAWPRSMIAWALSPAIHWTGRYPNRGTRRSRAGRR